MNAENHQIRCIVLGTVNAGIGQANRLIWATLWLHHKVLVVSRLTIQMESHASDANCGKASDIEKIRAAVQVAAQERADDCEALLVLLRQLEDLHRDIRETLFQDALPTNRHGLYSLLRHIEVNGGWPYIQRMKLAELLKRSDESSTPTTEASEG